MNAFLQEALGQAMFWGGVGCLPLAVGLFFMAFASPRLRPALVFFALGSLATTHFLWFFMYLGGALGTKVGEFHPTPWIRFLPIGFIMATGLTCVKLYARHKNTTLENRRQPLPHP